MTQCGAAWLARLVLQDFEVLLGDRVVGKAWNVTELRRADLLLLWICWPRRSVNCRARAPKLVGLGDEVLWLPKLMLLLLILLIILLVMASILVLSSMLLMQWLWIDPIGAILSSKVVVGICAPLLLLFSFSSSVLPKPGAIPPLVGGIVAVQTNPLSLGWHHGKCRRR